jgi:hypothetical protein
MNIKLISYRNPVKTKGRRHIRYSKGAKENVWNNGWKQQEARHKYAISRFIGIIKRQMRQVGRFIFSNASTGNVSTNATLRHMGVTTAVVEK